jgi:GntR family transcriptional regulator/MocR family aminotransferase
MVMSAPRRLALLSWARRADAWIIEDDYDSEFRYAGRPLPCLQGLELERVAHDGAPRVLYIGTFSKSLAPGLRVGFLVVPESLVDAVRAARSAIDRHPPVIGQAALAEFIGDGHYARHVRRVRALYAERQQALLDAVTSTLGDSLTIVPDPAGLHVVGWLRRGLSDTSVAGAALDHGVEVFPLSRFRRGEWQSDRNGLVLGYAGFEPRAIRRAVRSLARAIGPTRSQ